MPSESALESRQKPSGHGTQRGRCRRAGGHGSTPVCPDGLRRGDPARSFSSSWPGFRTTPLLPFLAMHRPAGDGSAHGILDPFELGRSSTIRAKARRSSRIGAFGGCTLRPAGILLHQPGLNCDFPRGSILQREAMVPGLRE